MRYSDLYVEQTWRVLGQDWLLDVCFCCCKVEWQLLTPHRVEVVTTTFRPLVLQNPKIRVSDRIYSARLWIATQQISL